jgi:hypothetical protein
VSRLARPHGTSARSARLPERVPETGRALGRDVELVTVFTGVASACDEHRLALVLRGDRAVVPQRRERGDEVLAVVAHALDAEARRLLEHLERVGPLQRYEGDVAALVFDDRVETVDSCAELAGHHRAVGGVRDDHEPVVARAIDHEVVDDPAVLGEEQRVLGLPDLDRRKLAGEGVVEGGARLGAEQHDLAHVREVEDARGIPDGVVLGEVARVAHGHLPAGEVGEARAGSAVHLVEWAAAFVGLPGRAAG